MKNIVDGREIAENEMRLLSGEIARHVTKTKGSPVLACIQAGRDSASDIYVKSLMRVSEKVGIKIIFSKLPKDVTEKRLFSRIDSFNRDRTVNGIIVQLPLPKHLNKENVFSMIDPLKDAEGVHPANLGFLVRGTEHVVPCTAAAVMRILAHCKVKVKGRNAVIIGHSNIVGKPLSMMLVNRLATVSVCHIETSKRGLLRDFVRNAEILVVAAGSPNLVKGDWLKKGCVAIDVGINRCRGRVVGDIEFDTAVKRAGIITKVPGGVGPLTVMMLMKNVFSLFKRHNGV